MTRPTPSRSDAKAPGFGHVLIGVVTRILLALVFFLVVTPVAIVMRAFGRDAMRQVKKSNEKSCRVDSKVRDASHVEKTY